MKIFFIFILFFSIPAFSCDSNSDGVPDHLALVTTQLAMLKSYQFKFNLKKPKEDAFKRLKIGDFRLLSMAANPYYPVSETKSPTVTEELVCMLGERFIEGVGDPIESEEQAILSDKFFKYAMVYNDTILENWTRYLKERKRKLGSD